MATDLEMGVFRFQWNHGVYILTALNTDETLCLEAVGRLGFRDFKLHKMRDQKKTLQTEPAHEQS